MKICCIVHNTVTEREYIVVANIPKIIQVEQVFKFVQSRLRDDELIMDFYDCDVEYRDMLTHSVDPLWIIDMVGGLYEISPTRFTKTGPTSRQRDKVEARAMCYLLIKNHTSLSLKQIARFFSNRDHATIIHGINKAKGLIEFDEGTRLKYEFARDAILKKYGRECSELT